MLTTLTRQLGSLDFDGGVMFRGWERIDFQNSFSRVLWEGNEGEGDRDVGGRIQWGMIWMSGIWDGRKRGIWRRIGEGGGELLKEGLMVERLTRHNRPFDDDDDDDSKFVPKTHSAMKKSHRWNFDKNVS